MGPEDSGGHVCGPRCEAASLLLSAGFLACFMGICGEWQLWNHFSFCQVVVRLSGVSLLGWPLLVNSLENIWFSLFLLKTKKKKSISLTPHLIPQTQTLNKHDIPWNPGRETEKERSRCSQHPNLIWCQTIKDLGRAPFPEPLLLTCCFMKESRIQFTTTFPR